jgi:flagellar biosynthesis protein FlhA
MYQHELGAVEALELFTLLTVGDGLVSQVPALLISTATGLVVTRAADDSNLGENIAKQIAGQSRPLAIASGVLFFLGAIPGLPTFSFWVLGSGAGWLAWIVSKQKEVEKTEKDVAQQKKETSSARTTENMAAGLLVTDPMELEIGYSLIPLVDVNQGGNLLERIQMLRKQSGLQLGLIVPSIRIRDNMQLNPDVYVIRIKGMEVARGQLMINHFLAVNPGTVTREIQGHETMEPAFGLPALWVTELQREEAELAGYTVADVASVVATHLTEIIKRHAHEILGRQEVQTMIDTLKENASCKDLIAELFPTVLKAGEFRKLLQNLLKEGVSIRNQITILEALDEAAADAAGDIDYLTERVREGLKRQITQSLLSPDGTLNVISLDPGLENHLAGAVEKGERGVYLAVEPDVAQKLWKVVAAESKKMTIHGLTPVILVSGAIRLYFRRFIEKTVSNVNVISYNEVSEDVNVNAVGIIRL